MLKLYFGLYTLECKIYLQGYERISEDLSESALVQKGRIPLEEGITST